MVPTPTGNWIKARTQTGQVVILKKIATPNPVAEKVVINKGVLNITEGQSVDRVNSKSSEEECVPVPPSLQGHDQIYNPDNYQKVTDRTSDEAERAADEFMRESLGESLEPNAAGHERSEIEQFLGSESSESVAARLEREEVVQLSKDVSKLNPVDVPMDGFCGIYSQYLILTEQFDQKQLRGVDYVQSVRDMLMEVPQDDYLYNKIPMHDRKNWNQLVTKFVEKKKYESSLSEVLMLCFCKKYNCNLTTYNFEPPFPYTSNIVVQGSGILSVSAGFFKDHWWPLFPSKKTADTLNNRSKALWRKLQSEVRLLPELTSNPDANVILLSDRDSGEEECLVDEIVTLESSESDDEMNRKDRKRKKDSDGDPNSYATYLKLGKEKVCGKLKTLCLRNGAKLKQLKPRVITSLLLNAPEEWVNKSRPFAVQQNCFLLVDLSSLSDPADVSSDGNGAFQHGTLRDSYIVTTESGMKSSQQRPTKKALRKSKTVDVYHVLKCSRDRCLSSLDFVRKTYRLREVKRGKLRDEELPLHNRCLVIYWFDYDPHEFKVRPHQNSTRVERPYMRKTESSRKMVKDAAERMTAYDACATVRESIGGYMSCLPDELPTEKQVRNNRSSGGGGSGFKAVDADLREFRRVIQKAQLEDGTRAEFIRRTTETPHPAAVLVTDDQLRTLIQCCCEVGQPRNSVLGIDPTFGLGAFDATITVFRHPAIFKNGRPVLMLGPILIHYEKRSATYEFFAAQLKSIARTKKLGDFSLLKCFISDGEGALFTAFAAICYLADHLRCRVHSERNIRQHLRQNGFEDCEIGEVIDDIFSPSGLVYADDDEMFDVMLESVKMKWSSKFEIKGAEFHSWMAVEVAPYLRTSMLHYMWSRNGFLKPPTTNDNEAMNTILSKMCKTKRYLEEFIDIARRFVYYQYNEMLLEAMAGTGDVFFAGPYRKFSLTRGKFAMLTEFQKRNLLAEIKRTSAVSRDNEGEHAVLVDDLYISSTVAQKAEAILQRDRGVCAGYEDNHWHVSSYGKKRCYTVFLNQSEELFECDCEAGKKGMICCHCVAVAKRTDGYKYLKDHIVTQANKRKSLYHSSGKKTKMARFQKSGPPRVPSEFLATTPPVAVTQSTTHRAGRTVPTPRVDEFHIYLFRTVPEQTKTCFGCRDPLGAPTFVVVTRMFRHEDARAQQNAYFHLDPICIKKQKAFHPTMLTVPDFTAREVNTIEKELLMQEAELIGFSAPL